MRPTPEAKPAERLEIGVLYGFRALMVLFVVNYHIWQQSWLPQYARLLGTVVDFDFFTRSGYLFVDGMMLLSGFLLYLPYARRKVEGTPVPGGKAVLSEPPYQNRAVLPFRGACGASVFRAAAGQVRLLRGDGQGLA